MLAPRLRSVCLYVPNNDALQVRCLLKAIKTELRLPLPEFAQPGFLPLDHQSSQILQRP